ncbi:MAG: hypothetical protein HZB38_03965, partial [Planctomycetes bacterium]|nr:hypothetical protein [Planctomycetota bacterium]
NGPSVELWAVNNAGRVVGSYTPDRMQAFAWQNGVARPLDLLVQPPLNRPLRLAAAINELGQIVASSNNESFVLSPVWLTGDLTGDCHVAIDDLLIVLANFGSPPEAYQRGDVDGDGDVDLSDLVLLLSHWHG